MIAESQINNLTDKEKNEIKKAVMLKENGYITEFELKEVERRCKNVTV